jgi:hypothetical protein
MTFGQLLAVVLAAALIFLICWGARWLQRRFWPRVPRGDMDCRGQG